jgi:NO-binding membrane sensor protein with MHYT domain
MGIQTPLHAGFDLRLLALSGFVLIVATYATLAFAGRIKSAQGVAWFAWLGGGASAMGIGIWSMHYLGLKALGLPVPVLNNSAVPFSILAAIFASGVTLLVVSGKTDSGRCVRGNQLAHSSPQASTGSLLSN